MSASDSLHACDMCGLGQRIEALSAGSVAECIRCGTPMVREPLGGIEVTAALTLAALVLYVPANIYPILAMSMYGTYTEATVWDGVVQLMSHGEYFIGIVVFLASIVVPLLKLLGLFFLVVTVKWGYGRRLRGRTFIYKFIEYIGPWAMLDVFLVAILVALVKMGDIGKMIPGPGLVAFTAVVVLTILASQSFDPKLIWNRR